MSKEKTLIYDGFVKLYTVEYENRAYDVVDFKDAVSAFVQSEDGDVLFVKQYRPAIGLNTLEIPAGVMDCPDLTAEQVMKKELLEEAGILEEDIISVEFEVSYLMAVGISKNTMIIFFVKVKNSAKDRPFADDDVNEKVWMTPEKVSRSFGSGGFGDAKTNLAISRAFLRNHCWRL